MQTKPKYVKLGVSTQCCVMRDALILFYFIGTCKLVGIVYYSCTFFLQSNMVTATNQSGNYFLLFYCVNNHFIERSVILFLFILKQFGPAGLACTPGETDVYSFTRTLYSHGCMLRAGANADTFLKYCQLSKIINSVINKARFLKYIYLHLVQLKQSSKGVRP